MCCCDKPNINGEQGYKWQPSDIPKVRPIDPPTIEDNDTLLYDEPGRCGGIDSHSFHYRVVKNCGLQLLVKHGMGEERISLSLYNKQSDILENLDSDSRYWMLNAIYHAYRDGRQKGISSTTQYWQQAASERRIKTRKMRNGDFVKVWVER